LPKGRVDLLKVAVDHFRKIDLVLSGVIDVIGDMNLRYRPANFEGFVRIIINQQLSETVASTIFRRLQNLVQSRQITPEALLSSDPALLKECGLSYRKIEYILGLATYFADDPNFISKLKKMEGDEVLSTLMSIRGIGVWSANIFRMFYLKDLDVFPYGDVSLEKAINLLYGGKFENKKFNPEQLVSSWSPYKSIASLYLWKWLDQGQPNIS